MDAGDPVTEFAQVLEKRRTGYSGIATDGWRHTQSRHPG